MKKKRFDKLIRFAVLAKELGVGLGTQYFFIHETSSRKKYFALYPNGQIEEIADPTPFLTDIVSSSVVARMFLDALKERLGVASDAAVYYHINKK